MCDVSPEALCAGCEDVHAHGQSEAVLFTEAATEHVTCPEGTCGSR